MRNNEKLPYEPAKIEVIAFENRDIITTSDPEDMDDSATVS